MFGTNPLCGCVENQRKSGMTRSSRNSAASPTRAEPALARGELTDREPPRWLVQWLPGLLTLLFLARWWVPTEGTELGETLPLMAAGLAVSALWGAALLVTGRWSLPRDGWTWGLLLLVGGEVLSASVVLIWGGQRRAAATWMWEWVATGMTCLLLRQMLHSWAARREWLILCVTAGVTLAGYGLTQRYYYYPQLRAQYDQLRSQLDELEQSGSSNLHATAIRLQQMADLRERFASVGISADLLSGRGRAQLENRLQHSSEPLGRFALANSFAGLLLVIWMLLTGLLGNCWTATLRHARRAQRLRLATIVVCWCLVGYCLLQTKSRTAFVGAAAGFALQGLLALVSQPAQRRRLWALLLGLGGLVAGGIVLAAATGAIDRLVLAETPKSLQYRLEYWWSTAAVIAESPLFGVGSGQFRQHYLAHKLPQSSEEIADPHNLVLDVWANGGLLALAGLIVLLVWAARQIRPHLLPKRSTAKVLRSGARIPLTSSAQYDPIQQPTAWRRKNHSPLVGHQTLIDLSALRWGAWLSCVVLWMGYWGLEPIYLGLAAGWGCVLLWWDRFGWDELPESSWWIAGLALTIHLLGAGGIAMPALTQLWLLCLMLSQRPWPTEVASESHGVRRFGLAGGLLLVAGLAGWQGWWIPVQARWEWERGDFVSTPGMKLQAYQAASRLDNWAPEPWERIAALQLNLWRPVARERPQEWETVQQAQLATIQRNPKSYQGYRTLAVISQELEHAFPPGPLRQQAAIEAAHWFVTAHKRYPHDAELLKEIALAYSAGGDTAEAQRWAQAALQQDTINRTAGHSDKYLTEIQLERLKRLISTAPSPPDR